MLEHTPGRSIQDDYSDEVSHCYGCGRLNPEGLHIQSRWDGDETVCVFTPRDGQISFPGYVYGGLIASLIDCHAIGTAAAASARARGLEPPSSTLPRFVTASLNVDFLRPTPAGVPLEVRARAEELSGRKVIVNATLFAAGVACARGRVVAVEMPATMMRPGRSPEN
jgi:acyl-coenzyme A thioesterase PaaI-like protein